ncbi:DNA alkylation repair protein [uncultured Ruminococcus sp.]|uniref:DNA alkylation repair protein n=1 Tax=uncultured Ruminococcus sp. TaxID=165186 RepID=UPI0025DB05D4|nr:DNA alkylation repair protein [uncultured Ruminococcus sp.]
MDIRSELEALRDDKYRDFQCALIPGLTAEHFLGVRTPELRKLAKKAIKSGDAEGFMTSLPHELFDEYQLHALMISETKGFEDALALTEKFLPHVDNWATCDQLRPKAFKGKQQELLPHIECWMDSGECFTVRFGIEMLMLHFLGEHYKKEYLQRVCEIDSSEYYVAMMQAWFFAEALAQHYEDALPFFEEGRLSEKVHNKAIQKATESLKISFDRKAMLSALKRKTAK